MDACSNKEPISVSILSPDSICELAWLLLCDRAPQLAKSHAFIFNYSYSELTSDSFIFPTVVLEHE